MKRTTVLAWIFALTIAHNIRLSAHDNLVVNGGFEMGFGGWLGTYGYVTDPGIAVEGRNVGVITDLLHSSVRQPMHQPISTVPGMQYTFSFHLLSGFGRAGEQSPGNAPVSVFWGDQPLGVFSNPSSTTWQFHQFQTIAITDSTTITFRTDVDPRWQLIDDVRVVAVPEPAPMIILSLVGVMVLCHQPKR